jgi:molybdate-binding protein/transcriptional regulator with XRE-family HTH domain
MTIDSRTSNRVREERLARGLSQADLAQRAGISRTAVTAMEGNRLVPSVAAALALAKALGTTVEALFGEPGSTETATWAKPPKHSQASFWEAEVGGQRIRYPSEASPMFAPLPDGMAGVPSPATKLSLPQETLVLACCDPASGLLATQYAAITGLRLLVLSRSTGQAMELLREGKVHVAGMHLSTSDEPGQNAALVKEKLGGGYHLLRIANWQEGIAFAPPLKLRSVRNAVRSKLTWIGREPGSGARKCLDQLLENRLQPRRTARNHRSVAEAIHSGWADAGICVRLACEENDLDFLPVQEETYELCVPNRLMDDRRVQALIRVVRSVQYRQLLGALPGYDPAETGDLAAVN